MLEKRLYCDYYCNKRYMMILAYVLMVLSEKVEKLAHTLERICYKLEIKCTRLHSGASIFKQCLKRLWPAWEIVVSSKPGEKRNKTCEFIICVHSNEKRMAKGSAVGTPKFFEWNGVSGSGGVSALMQQVSHFLTELYPFFLALQWNGCLLSTSLVLLNDGLTAAWLEGETGTFGVEAEGPDGRVRAPASSTASRRHNREQRKTFSGSLKKPPNRFSPHPLETEEPAVSPVVLRVHRLPQQHCRILGAC